MNFLSAAFAIDGFADFDRLHEVEPFAFPMSVGQAIYAARSQSTDRIARPESKAVCELFDSRFVSSVVAGGPGGMCFIERSAFEDSLVNSTGRDKNAPADTGRPGCVH